MPLAMARPVRHPKTGVFQFRKRVPAALVPLVGKREEKRSLGTKDPHEAKRLHARASAEVERKWANLRAGAVRLDHRQVHVLAGEVYRDLVDRHEREPGAAWGWSLLNDRLRSLRSRRGDWWADHDLDILIWEEINWILTGRGIAPDEDTWERLKRAVGDALLQAQQHLHRLANGDFRPDPDANRFPTEEVAPLTWDEAWALYLQHNKPSAATQKRWQPATRSFVEAVGTDMSKVTPLQVVNWRNALIARGLDAGTVRDVYVASVRTVLECAKSNLKLKVNPAAGIKTKVPKKEKLREKEFTPDEAHTILAATFARFSHLVTLEHAAARRWVPWLCAYTGARVNEMTQLRGDDIREEQGILCIRITPEAGTVKNKTMRYVPVHDHLLEQGFLEFVRKRGEGPLFYDAKAGRGGKEKGSLASRAGRHLSDWVRELGISDPNVAPNHGWRHLFKTRGRAAGIEGDRLDAIQGHAPPTEGGKYGGWPPEVLAPEIRKIPRFEVRPAASVDKRRRHPSILGLNQ